MRLRAIVPHGVDCPCVFNNEERDPLRFAHAYKKRTADEDGNGVDDEKSDIKSFFVTRDVFVVCDVE